MLRRMVAVALGVLALMPAPAVPASAGTPPLVEARAALLMNARSGEVLYELRGDEAAAPASLAKMATALVVAERLRPSDSVRISRAAAIANEDSILWPEGATFTVDQVLHGMIMESSNGAAIALAERAAGTVQAFLGLVNQKVATLGARHTTLKTPHGLDAEGQTSTARDLAVIARAYLDVPWLASVSATLTYQVLRWPPRGDARTFRNRNDFVRNYRGAIGLKNGYTSKAGNAVAAAAARGDSVIIAVVLNDRNVYNDASALVDYGFSITGVGTAPPPAVATPQTTTAPVTVAPGSNAATATSGGQQTQAEPPPATKAETTTGQAVAAPKRTGVPMKKVALFLLAVAYVWRVVKVRSRVRAKRRARVAAGRVEAMRPMYIPMQPQRTARRTASRSGLRIADEDDLQRARARR